MYYPEPPLLERQLIPPEPLTNTPQQVRSLISLNFISSPEPKAQGELIVWDSSRPPCVRPSVHTFNINISETSWPIIIKFHQKHHWGGGLTALGFLLDRIRTLVSMATDSSHRVIMGKIL